MSLQLIGDNPEYNPAQYIVIRGRLDEELFRRSAAVASGEAGVHRAVFGEGPDGIPFQALTAEPRDDLEVIDLTCEDDSAAAGRQWLRSQAARPIHHERPPLYSWSLLRISQDEHWWHMRCHHLIADLFSFGLLAKRAAEVYTALESLREYPPGWFSDWPGALHRNLDYHGSAEKLLDERYWLDNIEELVRRKDDFESPTHRPDSVRATFEADPALRAALRERCRELGVRPAHFLVASFAADLQRLTGDDAVMFSLPVAERLDEATRATPGMLANVVPFALRIPASLSVAELAARTGNRLAEIARHSRYRGEDLARRLGISRGGAWYGPVLNVVEFNRTLRFGAAVAEPPRNLSVGPVRDLTLTTYGWSHGTSAWLDFDLNASATALDEAALHKDRFLETLDHLVSGLAEKNVRHTTTFEIDRRLVHRWGDAADASAAGPVSVVERVRLWAEKSPDVVAVVCGGDRLTFAELWERSGRLAGVLAASGVRGEVGVGVALGRSLDLVVAFVGVLRAGGVYVPLPAGYPAERLSLMAADGGVGAVITDAGGADMAGAVCGSADAVVRIDRLPESAVVNAVVDHDSAAYVAFTSGSTGVPKGVLVSHRGLAGYAAAWEETLAGLDDERGPMLSMSGVGFDVSVGDLTRGLYLGRGVVLVPEAEGVSVETLHEVIARHRVGIAEIVPGVLLRELAAWAREAGGLDSLRVVISGTDVWRWDALVGAVGTVAPNAVPGNVYGVTEAAIDSLFMPLTDGAGADDSLVPVGRPLPGTRAFVLDERMQPTAIGMPGELFIGGAGVARGYVNRPGLTAERFVPDPFRSGERLYRTGDRARWNAVGNVEFLGRVDEQVKIRGFRIEPGEVEAVLAEHPAVRDAVVVARDDGPGGKRLVAYLVPDSPDAGMDMAQVRESLRSRLPGFMVPAAFVVLDQGLPLTVNGKVDRRALPAPEAVAETAGEYVPPRTDTERALAEIWQQVLGVERVGVEDDFFELGGDSILSLQIVARARAAGLRVEIADVFARQTVAALAAVAREVDPVATSAQQGPVSGPVPLTPIEHWFVGQDIGDRDRWNWSGMFELGIDVEPDALARAFDVLVAHHDALRMRLVFDVELQEWVQHNAETEPHEVFATFDVSGLHGDVLDEAVTDRMDQAQASLDLAGGPLIRAVLFERGDQPAWLGITVHHLVMDGVSWTVLLDDLDTAYQDQALGQKTTSFQVWAERLQQQAIVPATWKELPYWQQQLEQQRPLPTDVDGPNTEDSTQSVRVELDAENTSALLTRAHRAYRTQINDLLLAGLLRAVGQWSGTKTAGIDLESHGREALGSDIDLSRTVGWFTSIYPLALTTPDLDDPTQLISSVKEHLRGVPRLGVGYGLLRHITPEPDDAQQRERLLALRKTATPQILFNYMGTMDAAPAGGGGGNGEKAAEPSDELLAKQLPDDLAGSSTGEEKGRARSHLLQIEASQTDDGRMVFEWYYSANMHHADTVRRLADGHVSALRELIGHCLNPDAGAFTPSDFPMAKVDNKSLAAVLKKMGGSG
ncbi:amino acid adenylation domain-containing protein [Actinomadura darangshiensis]|uniref:Amino acid adenylation domain-containing protein n=2 Tax=Actinomadura darangshiensis TaxID=705336 RepID=A0A4R5BEC7_9ACTN|nr:amino acid adenylation domain-containing protein [Actinomadura darangshiensis]